MFYVPHSRYTEVRKEDILKVPELDHLVGISLMPVLYIVMGRNGREFFITGHSEYSPMTLDTEYKRDSVQRIEDQHPTKLLSGR